MSLRSLPHLLAVSVLALALAGCATSVSVAPTEPVEGKQEPAPSQTSDNGIRDLADAFAERDRFMRDQQMATDGSPLVAVTAAQKDFIAQQRAHIEAQGLQWTAQHESVYLALAADACETSILNAHDITAFTAQTHISSSPLFQALLQGLEGSQRAAGEQNLVSVMVFGTGFLCPGDAPQWEAVYRELYG